MSTQAKKFIAALADFEERLAVAMKIISDIRDDSYDWDGCFDIEDPTVECEMYEYFHGDLETTCVQFPVEWVWLSEAKLRAKFEEAKLYEEKLAEWEKAQRKKAERKRKAEKKKSLEAGEKKLLADLLAKHGIPEEVTS